MRAAIYTRKSKFTEEGESIENQINMCMDYAKRFLHIENCDVYEDEGFSGGNIDRPQFQKLIKDIKQKKYTHLICYRLDRISRNVADFTNTLKILDKYSCSFVSIKEQFDTSSAMGRAMMNISATFAQLERETIAERIKDNLRELSKTGRWLGGPAPLGFKSVEVENADLQGKSRKKHILQVDKEEIYIVKLIFKLFMQHKSYQRVSRELEKLNISSRKGRLFSRELVKQAITNPVYSVADKKLFDYLRENDVELYKEDKANGKFGAMPYNRRKDNGSFSKMSDWIVSVGEHQGIISSIEWIECQKIKDEIGKKASNRQGTSNIALLSGLVVCAKCGSGMASKQNKSGKYNYRYYSCNLKNKSADKCSNTSLNAYDAETSVVKYLKNIDSKKIIEEYSKTKKAEESKIKNTKIIDSYKKEIEENNKYLSALIKKIAIEEDADLLEDFMNERNNLKSRNSELLSLITELENKNSAIDDTEESLEMLLEKFEHFKKFYDYAETFEEQQLLIRSIVKFITWDSSTGKLEIILIGSHKNRPTPFSPLGDRSICSNYLKVKTQKIIISKKPKGYRADQKRESI